MVNTGGRFLQVGVHKHDFPWSYLQGGNHAGSLVQEEYDVERRVPVQPFLVGHVVVVCAFEHFEIGNQVYVQNVPFGFVGKNLQTGFLVCHQAQGVDFRFEYVKSVLRQGILEEFGVDDGVVIQKFVVEGHFPVVGGDAETVIPFVQGVSVFGLDEEHQLLGVVHQMDGGLRMVGGVDFDGGYALQKVPQSLFLLQLAVFLAAQPDAEVFHRGNAFCQRAGLVQVVGVAAPSYQMVGACRHRDGHAVHAVGQFHGGTRIGGYEKAVLVEDIEVHVCGRGRERIGKAHVVVIDKAYVLLARIQVLINRAAGTSHSYQDQCEQFSIRAFHRFNLVAFYHQVLFPVGLLAAGDV